jgi:hypothetical protein
VILLLFYISLSMCYLSLICALFVSCLYVLYLVCCHLSFFLPSSLLLFSCFFPASFLLPFICCFVLLLIIQGSCMTYFILYLLSMCYLYGFVYFLLVLKRSFSLFRYATVALQASCYLYVASLALFFLLFVL